MRKLDYAHTKAVQVAQQMPGLLQTIGVPYTPSVDPVEMPPRVFQDKSFDVTNNMDQICSCATTKLDLGPEEAFLTTNMMCGTVKQHRECDPRAAEGVHRLHSPPFLIMISFLGVAETVESIDLIKG